MPHNVFVSSESNDVKKSTRIIVPHVGQTMILGHEVHQLLIERPVLAPFEMGCMLIYISIIGCHLCIKKALHVLFISQFGVNHLIAIMLLHVRFCGCFRITEEEVLHIEPAVLQF